MKKFSILAALLLICNVSASAEQIDKSTLIRINSEIRDELRKQSEERVIVNILKNSELESASKAFWRLHNCRDMSGGKGVEFKLIQPVFTQLWQTVPLSLPPGTQVRIEARISLSGIAEGVPQPNLPQLAIHFYDESGKTRLYADRERGRGLTLTNTNGQFKDFALDYTVPEGSVSMAAAIKANTPGTVNIDSIRLLAPLGGSERRQLGIESGVQIRASGVPAAERAKKFFKPGEIYPVVFPHTINIDGAIEDWDKVPFLGECAYEVPRFQPLSGSGDAQVRFKAAADADFLYLLVKVVDDKLMFANHRDHNDDSIEIFLSPTFNQTQNNLESDFHITISPESAELKRFHLSGSHNYRGKVIPRIAGVKVDGGWGVEVAIPLQNDLVEIRPYDMFCMGFNVAYNDNDSGSRDHKLSWSKDRNDHSWRDPSVLGALLFLTDENVPTSLPTLVRHGRDSSEDELKVETFSRRGSLNILRNGNFAAGDLGWTQWYGNEGTDYTVVDDASASAGKSLCVDGRKLNLEAMAFRLCSHSFNVIAGEQYTFRFKARSDATRPLGLSIRTKDPFYTLQTVGTMRIAPGEKWTSAEMSFVVPEIPKREQNVMQLMIDGRSGGKRIWVDDLELYRHVPASWDADLVFDRSPYVFANTEEVAGILRLNNTGMEKIDLDIQVQVRDMYFSRAVSNARLKVELAPGESQDLSIPLTIDRNGFYRLRTIISNQDSADKIFRETDFAVYKRPLAMLENSGACILHQIYLNDSVADVTQSMVDAGIGSTRIFVERTQEYAEGEFDFSSMELLVDECLRKGIKVTGCLKVFDWRNRNPVDNLLEFERYVRAIARHFKGRIEIWEIGNEPNLWMGWPPLPDPDEYGLVLRTAWNAVRAEDPDALVATAGFNRAKFSGYIEEFLKSNRGNFYDIFAFHPYEFMKSDFAGDDILETVLAVEEYHPNPQTHDTESGVERTNVEEVVEMLAKKKASYMYWGVVRHHEFAVDKMCSGHFYTYLSSPGPAYPAYAFINNIYAGAESLGEIELGQAFSGYLFRRGNDNFAVIWRNKGSDKDICVIACNDDSRVLDVFGNDISDSFVREAGKLKLSFRDRNPVYVTDVKTENMNIRTRPGSRIGSKHIPYNQKVLLAPARLRGGLSASLARGASHTLPFYIKNYSDKAQDVSLSFSGAANISVKFTPATLRLQPGETIPCAVEISHSAEPGTYRLVLEGTADGMPMAPVNMQVSVTGDVAIHGSGSTVHISNNSSGALSGRLVLSSRVLNISPYQTELTLAPGESRSVPVKLTPSGADSSRTGFQMNGRSMADFTFISGDGRQFKESGEFYFAAAYEIRNPGKADQPWIRQWSEAQPFITLRHDDVTEKFSGRIMFRYSNRTLFIAAEVEDAVHFQNNRGGFIGNGDAIIIGVDQKHDSSDKGLDANDFECGFALGADKRVIKYRWDGKYGLESATEFSTADARIFRESDRTFYNLAIPLDADLSKGGSLGVSVKIVNRNAHDGTLSTLEFGEGLGENRNASAFGVLLLR